MQHFQLFCTLKKRSLEAGNSRFVQLLVQFVSTGIALFITPRGLTFYWQLVVSKSGIQKSSSENVLSGIWFSLSLRHVTFGEKMEVRDLGQYCYSGEELLPLDTLTHTQRPFFPAASQMGNLSLICWQITGMHYFCFAQFEWRSGLRPRVVRPSVNCFDPPRIKKQGSALKTKRPPTVFVGTAVCREGVSFSVSVATCWFRRANVKARTVLLVKSRSNSTDLISRYCWQDNIKMNLEEVCHRIGTSGVLLWIP